MDVRVGSGFDAHRFAQEEQEHNFIMLCNVRIPHNFMILAHSDGDCALHALVDAIFGTFGAGDIGIHFPPTDIKWKDANSAQFLLYALKLLEEAGGKLNNIDLTIIGERPKISPHREAMVARMMELTGLPKEKINIKATTTEKMGFTGRKEGIAVSATVTAIFD